jgi:signal transduction histidine kinase
MNSEAKSLASDPAAPKPFGPSLLRASWRSWWQPDLTRDPAGPEWLQWVWTVVFNTGMAVVLTVVFWGFSSRATLATALEALWQNFVVAQSIGLSIHLLFRIGLRLLGADRVRAFTWAERVVFYAGIPILGVLIGYAIGLTLLGVDVVEIVSRRPQLLFAILMFSLLMSTFWYRYMLTKARMLEAEAERERERARALEAEKQSVDAQLRALQAQIEPHFLFNTLANVASLIDTAPDRAQVMLARLIDLLRGSLDASRAAHGTLGQELALVRAYLDILRIRMGARLRVQIDVPDELHALPLAPLLLQPLVENAIKHGLEPKVEGGTVHISGAASEASLTLCISDDGLGFRPSAASGVGLVNLRERLRASFGGDAQLTVEELNPGTRLRLVLPREGPAREAFARNEPAPLVRVC